jgi:hypothetical protein
MHMPLIVDRWISQSLTIHIYITQIAYLRNGELSQLRAPSHANNMHNDDGTLIGES